MPLGTEEKSAFQELCHRDPSIPVFLSYDWMEGIADEEDWGVRFAGEPEDPKGFFVFFIKRKYGFKRILMPPLTPYLGPWIFYPEGQKRTSIHAYEKKVSEELIDQLPSYDELIMDFHPRFRNWLPFFWNGFEQSTRYSYHLYQLSDLEEVRAKFRGNTRRALQKGEEELKVHASEDLDTLYNMVSEDLRKKGLDLFYDRQHLKRIDHILKPKGQRKILYAKDHEGRTHAGTYLVLDHRAAYYLIGAGDRSIMHNGAMPLLIWEGIRTAAASDLYFDFEGSMLPSIERFFRSFGAEQTYFHHIERTKSPGLKIRKALNVLRGGA